MIESGELDVLVAIDETLEDTDILIRRPLRRETAHLIARKGHPLTQMERCAYADIIQYRFASPFMTDNLIRWFQAGRNDETRQAHYLICHDYHVLSEAMLRFDCVGMCTEPDRKSVVGGKSGSVRLN